MKILIKIGQIASIATLLFILSSGSIKAEMSAPDFTLMDMAGEKVSLSSFNGRPVLLNFWATWCGYCRKERPHLNTLHNTYKDQGLVVISVSTDRSIDKVRKYLMEIPADFIVLSDSDGRVASLYGIRGYPSSFLIDREGIVKSAFAGYRDWTNESSVRMIDQLIKGE